MLRSAIVVVTVLIALAASAAELKVTLPGREDLILDLPAGWSAQVQRPRQDLPPTITIKSADPRSFQILVTPIWPVGAGRPPTASDIRSMVQGAATQAASQSVERDIKLMELASSGKPGYYFSATDRAPQPDGFKYMTQGAIAVEELRVTFTILVNGEGSQTVSQALEVLRSARRARGKSAA